MSKQKSMTKNKPLTAKEVAEELGVHPYTVHGYLRSGLLQGFKLRTHWRVTREAVNNFIKRRGVSNS